MDRPPPRGPRGGGGGGGGAGGGGRRGGGGGTGAGGNERYGGRATDPNHSNRKRSRSRSPESRNYRENYRERDGRGEREYPKHDGGRGGDRENRGGGPLRRGGRDHDAPPERERPALPERGDRDREYTGPSARSADKGGRVGSRGDDKSRRYRSKSRDRHATDRRTGRPKSRERDTKRTDGARSRSRERQTKERTRRGGDVEVSAGKTRSEGRRTASPGNNKSAVQPPPPAQDTDMAGTEAAKPTAEDDMEAQMQTMLGFGGFGTTKQKKVKGNDVGAISKNTTTKYRQYMNRPGGFNRALSPS
ncbi:hypothetical protein Q9L58_000204 [Maublancomyces gigas]|uniref:U4/U6.U5 small nuclear ribonucleoprotein 27kDa protein domain-containing protein n=1 Tax=Discina gigas TaxID=1032678 RepID=A0ABR3GY65_9PEZI